MSILGNPNQIKHATISLVNASHPNTTLMRYLLYLILYVIILNSTIRYAPQSSRLSLGENHGLRRHPSSACRLTHRGDEVKAKLLPGIIASGITLIVALLLCQVIDSPTAWAVTWIACVIYAMVALAAVPFQIAEHRRSMQEIRCKLGL